MGKIPNPNVKLVKSKFQTLIIVQQVRPAPLTFLILWSFCGRVGQMGKYILMKAPSTVLETNGVPVTGGPLMICNVKLIKMGWTKQCSIFAHILESAVGNNFSIDKFIDRQTSSDWSNNHRTNLQALNGNITMRWISRTLVSFCVLIRDLPPFYRMKLKQ